MKKFYYLFIMVFCCSAAVFAQTPTIQVTGDNGNCFPMVGMFISGQDATGRNIFIEDGNGMGAFGLTLRYSSANGRWELRDVNDPNNVLYATGPNTFSPNPPDSGTETFSAIPAAGCQGTATVTGADTQTTAGGDPCAALNGDSDGDMVCDDNDACPGFDDNADMDSDGIPDGCDANPNTPDGFLIESPCFGQDPILLTLDGTDATGRNIYRNTVQSLEVLYNASTMNWEVREINAGMAVLFTSSEASSPNPPSSSFSPYAGSGFCNGEMGMVSGSGTQDVRCLNSCDDGDPCTTDTQDIDCNCTYPPEDTPPTALCQNVTTQLNATGNAMINASDIDNGSNDACGMVSLSANPTAFDCTNVGANTSTLTVTDANGNSATCTATVTVQDVTPPNALCQNITLYLDNSGNATITPADVDAGSTDNCGIDDLSVSPSTFDCDDTANNPNIATLTATDGAGNVSSCEAQVMVRDTVSPVALCQDVTVQLDANGESSTTAEAVNNTSTDACGIGGLALDITTFACAEVGDNTVVLTVTDQNGNSSTCEATVTVEDNVPPVANCQNVTVQLDANGEGSTTAEAVNNTSTDACGIGGLELDITTFACAEVGDNTVVLTVTDQNGNSSTCEATVTVEDNVSPVANCQNVTVQLDANGEGSTTAEAVNNTSTDACGIGGLALDITTFACAEVGDNTVVLTVTDQNGNSSTCEATVTVEDNVPPVANCQNVTVQLDANGEGSTTVDSVNNTSTDACGIGGLALDVTNFLCADVGANTVVLTVTDQNGNSSTCEATVTVEDNVPPVANCQNVTVQLDANGEGSTTAEAVNNTSTDACGIGGLALDVTTFACAEVGDNTVVLTVTDQNGNSSTCEATVTVEDNVPPVANCQNVTVQLDANGEGSTTAEAVNNTSTDACGIGGLELDITTFACAEVGDNTVVLTVTDQNGNSSTCEATVTVEDNVPPVANCQNVTVQLDANGEGSTTAEAVNNTSTDACGIGGLELDVTNFICEDLGDNTVVLTVTDQNGNSATCEATVTVEDNVPPVALCQNVTVQLDANGEGSTTAEAVNNTSTDACGIGGLELDITTFACAEVGDNTVVLTVTDQNGNSSTCEATVTVEDNVPPVANCQNVTVQLDANGEGSTTAEAVNNTSTDACGIGGLELDVTNFTCEDVGENTVVLTVTDQNGNSSTCEATVTVEDNVPPVALCQPVTVQLDANGEGSTTAEAVNNTSTDACGIGGLELDVTDFICEDLGDNTVVLTVTDQNGNSSTCEATVTVADTIRPVVTCLIDTVYLDENGEGAYLELDLFEATDNCEVDFGPFDQGFLVDCSDVGTDISYPITVRDFSANSASCTATVRVLDTIPPAVMANDTTLYLDENGLAFLEIEDYNYAVSDNCDASVTDIFRFDASAPIMNNLGAGAGAGKGSGAKSLDQILEFNCDDVNNPFIRVEIVGQDASGNETRDTITVTVLDTIAPDVVCLDIEVFLDETGSGGYAELELFTATDNCAVDFAPFDQAFPVNCEDIGVIQVPLTISDVNGNDTMCVATVTVEDNLAPIVTTTDQMIVLNDNNVSQTLVTSDLVTATDNCGEPITIVFDRSLTFDGTDIGTNVLTATVTDANGNVTVVTVTVIVTFDQPNLACIGEINLTLNDECQALIIPRMVLTGNTGLIDAFPFMITVMDSDPSNGPIIDGCGEFTYSISVPTDLEPTFGFRGDYRPSNWTEIIFSFDGGAQTVPTDEQLVEVDFTSAAMVLSTQATVFNTGSEFGVQQGITFTETGTVNFDYDFNGVDAGFDQAFSITTFEGDIVEIQFNANTPTSGTASAAIEPGYSLIIQLRDDGFQPFAPNTDLPSVLTIDNFSFIPPVNPLALDFETCWGIVRAEDKTSPEAETVPDDVELLCVDLDGNNLSTLPASVSKCYRVDGQTGATIPGTMTAALRARLLAGGLTPLVPVFTDGCAQQLEVCVSDAVAFGADPSCDDVVITRTFVATEVSTCVSASGEENAPAVASYTLTFERPTLADLNGNSIEAVVNIESCGSDPSARPAPRNGLGTAQSPNDYPFLQVGDRTFFLENGEAVCNIGVTYSDGPSIVTCPNTYKFVRTYTVIDWCEPSDVRTFTQVVKVGDSTAPTLVGPNVETEADGTLVYGTNAGNSCAAFIRLDDITVTDNCPGAVTITAEIFPNGNLNGAPIGAFTVVPGGAPELTPAIPAGTHILRYTYSDVCGNTGVTDYDFRVEDQTPPVAICEDGLNVSIAGGANNGFAVLTPANIDNGSYDDCSAVTLEIARVNTSDLAIGGYGPQITLTCADIGTVRVGLKVTDALGNMNFCWLDVLVEDKIAPTCVAPGNTTITCVDYNASLPNDITDASFAQLDALFGQAAGVDNCGTTITQTVSGTINSCGVGRITRSFTSTDDVGLTNANVCLQVIDVIGIHDYRITFPTDEEGDCMEIPSFDAVVAEELACDLITTTVDVDTLRTQLAGDECFKLRVTYDVVNWCEYNSLGEPYVVRRDAPGAWDRTRNPRNIDEDLLYVNVIPGATTATIADDIAFYSLIETDRLFNPAPSPQRDQEYVGYADNANDSRGFFRYTQFIKIYDEVAPEITFTEPAECFAGSGEGCRTTVTLEFTATDECSDATVSVMLDANFTGVFAADNAAALGISVSVANDGEGNYTLTATNVPVGAHAIRVRANDGCGNSDVQIIEFCVTADRTPTPICIQTLTVTLMTDGNGGGIAAIWASDFIASPIVDCFGNVVDKYSLYRSNEAGEAGFTPVVGQLGIDDIDCDDLGDLSVRVYAFDDNGSTPDYCEVIVEVQDNMGWCDGSTGNLSGLIATPNAEVIAGVQVSLTSSAGMDATTTTSAAGTYSFTGLALNADYTVQPVLNASFNAQNVRASDLVAGIGQILGTAPFTSAYQFVAADVNQDASFDVFDILAGQRAILGLDDGFAGGNWFMVEAGSAISMNNPYAVAFPEVFNANDLQGAVTADFVAVEKMNLTGATGRVAQTLNVDDAQLESGQLRTIILDGMHTAGFQGTIELAAGLELIAADLTGQGGLNLNRAGEGLIAVLLREGGSVRLEVRATTSGLVSELITLSDAVTVREGVALNGTSNGLDLAFNADFAATTAQNVLYQNTPNPVVNVTNISFELAVAGAATLTVQDVAGRLVRTVEVDGVAGLNRIDVENLGAAGVYSYTLTSGNFTATKQMVVVE